MSKPGASVPVPHLGYLTSQYPFTSHTFISREVAAVRRLGAKLDTFSIRAPLADPGDELAHAEALTTYVVLRQSPLRFLIAHTAAFFSDPAAYLSTMRLAVGHRAPGAKGFALSLAHFAEAILLGRELRRRGIQHLHNHFANSAATVGYLATRLIRIPWSFTMHGISETDYPAGLLLGRKIHEAAFVACVSYFGRAQAMRLVAPSEWGKLHIIRCGLPLASLNHLNGPRRRQIICVGRLSPEKGHIGLFQAFATVAEHTPDIQLTVVGDGPESLELRTVADNLGLSDRISFLGRLAEEDTMKEIARSEMLVLPSFMEGLPVVLMEAMAVGTPVIASRVAGIPELVEHGKTGLLFTPSKWEELACCIRMLAADEKMRAGLAAMGRSRVAAEFDSERSARQLVDLFRGTNAQ